MWRIARRTGEKLMMDDPMRAVENGFPVHLWLGLLAAITIIVGS